MSNRAHDVNQRTTTSILSRTSTFGVGSTVGLNSRTLVMVVAAHRTTAHQIGRATGKRGWMKRRDVLYWCLVLEVIVVKVVVIGLHRFLLLDLLRRGLWRGRR